MPPLEQLASPELVDNPIELAHGLAIRWADAYRKGEPRVEP
jgi:hypothetical protein